MVTAPPLHKADGLFPKDAQTQAQHGSFPTSQKENKPGPPAGADRQPRGSRGNARAETTATRCVHPGRRAQARPRTARPAPSAFHSTGARTRATASAGRSAVAAGAASPGSVTTVTRTPVPHSVLPLWNVCNYTRWCFSLGGSHTQCLLRKHLKYNLHRPVSTKGTKSIISIHRPGWLRA